MRPTVARCLVALLAVLAVLPTASAQGRGDYLTEGELDLVRDIRRIDNRVDVFMKIAARRLNALEGRVDETLDSRSMKFGPLPKGTEIHLLDDYRRTIDELMTKFEDEYSRTGMTDDLRKALEIALVEIERQMKELDTVRPKLKEDDAGHFVEKALSIARELRDGAKQALDANPAPAKKS